MKYKNKFLVFEVENGPKPVIDSLNTEGESGWELAGMLAISDGNQIIVFLKQGFEDKVSDPEENKKESIKALWSSDE